MLWSVIWHRDYRLLSSGWRCVYIFQYIFCRKKSRCTTPVPCQTVYFGGFMSVACLDIYKAHALKSTAHFHFMLERRQWRIQVLWHPGRVTTIAAPNRNYELNLLKPNDIYTRWFKYDRDWFVCKQAALRSSCATLREWSHNLHPPSCSG